MNGLLHSPGSIHVIASPLKADVAISTADGKEIASLRSQ
jgi:hypothetical protein